MATKIVEFAWYPLNPHGYNPDDDPGRWMPVARSAHETRELWGFLRVDLEFRLDRVEGAIQNLNAAIQGHIEPGEIDGGNDGVLAYGGGHVMITSLYADDDRVVMTAEQCLLLLTNVRDVMTDPDYRNPDREPFPPFELDIIATGENAINEYWRRGGITPRMPDPPPK